jgi:predicted transcriptional regulator
MRLKPLEVIESAASKIAPGRAPYFVEAHLVKALTLIDAEGPVGRVTLSKTLELSEGTVRTLIRHLEKGGLIRPSKSGIALTNSGKKLCSILKSRISQPAQIPKSSLTVGAFNAAVLIKDAMDSVKTGLEQRDAAIKVGASGATTLIFSKGKLNMPLVKEDIFSSAPTLRKMLVSKLNPQENDVIIIGSAEDKSTAELGALAAALETLELAKG